MSIWSSFGRLASFGFRSRRFEPEWRRVLRAASDDDALLLLLLLLLSVSEAADAAVDRLDLASLQSLALTAAATAGAGASAGAAAEAAAAETDGAAEAAEAVGAADSRDAANLNHSLGLHTATCAAVRRRMSSRSDVTYSA